MAIQQTDHVESGQQAEPVTGPQPRLFTVDEYYRMAEVGILRPDERTELIEGVIVEMSPSGGRHIQAVVRLNRQFAGRLLPVADISIQNPIRLAERVEPEPDVAIIRIGAIGRDAGEPVPPSPADIYLLVEVADTSVSYDTGEKAALYARYGIPELWVLDLPGDRVLVHREPTANGYVRVESKHRGETITPLSFPGQTLTIEELLG